MLDSDFLDYLKPWETSFLGMWVWGIGAVVGLYALGGALVKLKKWKRAETPLIVGCAASFLFMVVSWGVLLLLFTLAESIGWVNGTALTVIFIANGVLLFVIVFKVFELIAKYDTMRKFSIWGLIVAGPAILFGSYLMIAKVLERVAVRA